MKFGNDRNNLHQTRTPEITIRTAEGEIACTGFIKGEDMVDFGSWRWVKVYSDKSFERLMTFDNLTEQICKIRWFSEKPYWYRDISWGGLSFVAQ